MIPTIFIPGIEATALVNANTFDFQVIWNSYDNIGTAIGTKLFGPSIDEKLQRNPLYDENVNSIIERNHIASLPYEASIKNFASKTSDPIYLFGYDWRQSNAEAANKLLQFITYLQNKLIKFNVTEVNIITHSMGSHVLLCLLTKLKLIGNFNCLNKLILTAPPLKGSPYALVHMVKGNGGLKSFLNRIIGHNDDIRKVLRTYPAVLELLPWYDGALNFSDKPDAVDLTNIANWQPNIYDSICDDPAQSKEFFIQRLSDLSQYRNNILFNLNNLPANLKQKTIIVAGTGDKTFSGLKISSKGDGTTTNLVDFNNPVMGTGDGTVPIQSSTDCKNAITTFVVAKDSFLSQLGDNIDFHGLFLRDSRVQNIVSRFLTTEINLQIVKQDSWWQSVGSSVTIA